MATTMVQPGASPGPEGAVRYVHRKGEPWFVARDVCVALGFQKNGHKILRGLDDDERLKLMPWEFAQVSGGDVLSTETAFRAHGAALVNEPGLYHLMLVSRKPEVRAFRKWVTREVLPALHETGSYDIRTAPPETLEALRGALAVVNALEALHFDENPLQRALMKAVADYEATPVEQRAAKYGEPAALLAVG
ncbi:Bro-N domain-containing protein [Streptomyces sp. NPDC053474]|uniref:Bro-N domain-containing protein n=1 Tax=Streptomyces sp. NPDC053474 TaxID=3365704 RepID=UPI0037D3CD5A